MDIVSDSCDSDKEIMNDVLPKRNRKANPFKWKQNKNKRMRMKGAKYVSSSKKGDLQRPARQLGEPCSSNFCSKSALRNCSAFAETVRREIFNSFWAMSWDQKRLYVINLVNCADRKQILSEVSKRTQSFAFFLRLNTNRLQVCRQMFLSTLGLSEKMVRMWIRKSEKYGMQLSRDASSDLRIKAKRASAKGQRNQEKRAFLQKWLAELPKIESHYCRKRSKKLYLESSFSSYQNLYKLYEDYCNLNEEDSALKLSYPIFMESLRDQNLSIIKPKKDECDVCVAYKAKNGISDEEYEKHRYKIKRMREEKETDIVNAKSGLCDVFCMDMQALKLVPQLNASAAYYKMKLHVHNFTIYNTVSHESHNYVWDETDGNLMASVFATCIIKHLENHILQSPWVHHIILYSDGCFYQNRNVTLSNALLSFCQKTSITVEQKYLISGHTQMECDSTHSLIERKMCGKQISLPSQFVQVIREARKHPSPLQAHQLHYYDFLDFENIPKRYLSIRPGRSSGDPTVNMLRALAYDSSGSLYYKTEISEEYEILPQRSKIRTDDTTAKKLYKNKIAISKKRWEHLQDLKKFLPFDCHHFYDELAFKN